MSNTQLLKFKLNDAFSHLVETETAQRGFILTRDSSFLREYVLAKQPIPGLLSDIKNLVTNNAEQNNNLRMATELFQSRLDYIDHTLNLSEKLSGTELNSRIMGGKQVTYELGNRIEQMITTEDGLLRQRIAAKQAQERYTSIFILVFSFLSIGLLVFGFFRLKREILSNTLLQEKVKERTEEIRIANEMLSRQNVELKQKNEELSSFIFVANHDLKEPLRKIEFFTTKITDSDDTISSENKTLLSKTIQCVKRMKVLLEDIFIYTRTNKVVEYEITDLNKVTDTAIKNLQETIIHKGAIIEYRNLPKIKAVPQQMEQLFTNLLSNSLKYSKKDIKPYIKIEAEKENGTPRGGFWKIRLRDNGIGFNDNYREKIFEMFQRLHLKHEYQGTGIGLTICKKIVENHNGTITASSENEDGAVFTVLLPDGKT